MAPINASCFPTTSFLDGALQLLMYNALCSSGCVRTQLLLHTAIGIADPHTTNAIT